MESFKRVNKYGEENNYYVVARCEEDGTIFVVYTDFAAEKNGEMRLFVGAEVGDQIVDVEDEKAERLIHEFRDEVNQYRNKKNEGYHYEDLSFTTTDSNGQTVINDITSVIPNKENKEEPYVVFTDYSLDSHDEFIYHYGRLVGDNDNYSIETQLSADEVNYIQEMLKDEVVQYVNETIGESLND